MSAKLKKELEEIKFELQDIKSQLVNAKQYENKWIEEKIISKNYEIQLRETRARLALAYKFQKLPLPELLSIINEANIPESQLFFQSYLYGNTRNSDAYSDAISEGDNSANDFSKFRRRKSSKTFQKIIQWIPDFKKIELFIKKEMPSAITDIRIDIIKILRKMFFHLYSERLEKAISKEGEFQPLMEKLFSLLLSNNMMNPVQILNAQSIKLEVSIPTGKAKSRIYKGHTDGIIQSGIQTRLDLKDFLLFVELKSPFGSLFRTCSYAARDQLFIQIEAFATKFKNTEERNKPILGLLTDLFTISFQGKYLNEKNEPIYVFSRRAYQKTAKQYLLLFYFIYYLSSLKTDQNNLNFLASFGSFVEDANEENEKDELTVKSENSASQENEISNEIKFMDSVENIVLYRRQAKTDDNDNDDDDDEEGKETEKREGRTRRRKVPFNERKEKYSNNKDTDNDEGDDTNRNIGSGRKKARRGSWNLRQPTANYHATTSQGKTKNTENKSKKGRSHTKYEVEALSFEDFRLDPRDHESYERIEEEYDAANEENNGNYHDKTDRKGPKKGDIEDNLAKKSSQSSQINELLRIKARNPAFVPESKLNI